MIAKRSAVECLSSDPIWVLSTGRDIGQNLSPHTIYGVLVEPRLIDRLSQKCDRLITIFS